jgi:hypothetical protein
MSSEIKITDTQIADGPSAAPNSNGATPQAAATVTKSKLWQRPRVRIATVAAILVAVVALIGNNVIARQYTPDGAVRQYLGALQSGDSATAWSQIQVAAPTQPADVALTDQSALRAAIASGRPDIKSFEVTSTSSTGASTAIVSVTYETSSGTHQAKFSVEHSGQTRLGIYPVWQLVLTPTLLQIALPKGSAGVAIDGKAIVLPDGKSTVAVLPLMHKIQFAGTQMLTAKTVNVDAFGSLALPVAYQPTLTSAGLAKAKGAVKAVFDNCAKLTSANVDVTTCPQSMSNYVPYSGQWQLIGDPTQDLAVTFDKDMNALGTGHYQMAFAYQESSYQGTNREPSAGGYSTSLLLSASDLTVGSIQAANGLPGLTRPDGATDQAAMQLVAAGLKQCAAVRAEWVASCPQRAPQAILTNVHWTLQGDPTAGATVAFDPKTGVFTVHDNFAMGVTYDWFGNASGNRSSYVTAYDAYLFWDGQKLELVNIDGSN